MPGPHRSPCFGHLKCSFSVFWESGFSIMAFSLAHPLIADMNDPPKGAKYQKDDPFPREKHL